MARTIVVLRLTKLVNSCLTEVSFLLCLRMAVVTVLPRLVHGAARFLRIILASTVRSTWSATSLKMYVTFIWVGMLDITNWNPIYLDSYRIDGITVT